MSLNERLRKASKFCEENRGYSLVFTRGERKPLLVRNSTGVVGTYVLA